MSLARSPFLPQIPAVSSNRGSLLTVLCLCCSFYLFPAYNRFRSELESALPFLDNQTLPTTSNKAINTALEVLQREKVKENEDPGDTANQANQPQAPVDEVKNALEILVRNATEEFGFAPSDVYEGVVNLPMMRQRHTAVVKNLNYEKLRELVRGFTEFQGLEAETSHNLIVVYPYPSTPLDNFDEWAVDFKSVCIAKKAVESMRSQEDARLREFFWFFYDIPTSSTLARWFFEAIVHRLFSNGWKSMDVPQPIPMATTGLDPPTFSTGSPSATPGTSFVALRANPRIVTRVDFARSRLSDVTLDPNKYYIPAAATNPLFDSFTINIDPRGVLISIFQITTSPRHEGSAEGYSHIHRIMRRARELLKETGSNATVKVAYCLVCPDDEFQHRWEMPVGWDKSTKTNDHRGNGFSIRVPVSGRYGMLCLFTPNFATELNHG
jgi:hypothetical protein